MTLQDRISSCRVIMSEVQSNKSRVDAGSERAKSNNQFFDSYITHLLPSLTAYVLVKEKTEYKFPQDAVLKLKECLDYVSTTLETKQVLNVASFRTNAVIARDKLEDAWKKYATDLTQNLFNDLGILRLVYEDKMEVTRIANTIRGIITWPVREKQLNDCIVDMEKAKVLLQSVKFDHEIEGFLKKVRDRQATLLDLSDPIIKWIRENDFEGSIQLVIRG